MKKASVIPTGRVGEVIVHDDNDDLFHYKLQFNDGFLPSADWFHKDSICICGSSASSCKMDVSDEDLLCAICFEEAGRAVELPCACNVAYCAQCWDRALAQSFNVSGDATCPTCRTPICVDFDPDKLCLVFLRVLTLSAPVVDDCDVNAARIQKNR